MALGPLRGPCPDLRSVGLRGSRLQAGRKRRAPDEGRAPGAVRAASAPHFGERGRRQKKPKKKGAEDAGRAQGETAAEAPGRAAGTEDPSHVSGRAPSVSEAGSEPDSVPESGPTTCWDEHSSWSARLCHPPSQADSRAAHIVGPEARGRVVVEARDWLETRGHGK